MNTREFSIQRFGALLKSEIDRNRKEILIFTGVILGLYLISPLLNEGRLSTHAFTTYIGTITFVLPFIFYKNLFHTTKGVAFGMMPTSQTEKFLAMFTLCALVMPVGMLVFSWIISLIGFGLTGNADMMFNFLGQFTNPRSHHDWFNLGFFDSFFWSVISAQSFTIWGVCFFKNSKFWRTMLTGFCAIMVVSILGSAYGLSLFFNHQGVGYESHLTLNGAVIERLSMIATVFVQICLPILLWAWSFLKIRRQQF